MHNYHIEFTFHRVDVIKNVVSVGFWAFRHNAFGVYLLSLFFAVGLFPHALEGIQRVFGEHAAEDKVFIGVLYNQLVHKALAQDEVCPLVKGIESRLNGRICVDLLRADEEIECYQIISVYLGLLRSVFISA